jgi:3-methyladenine DNA glycosylase Tag
MGDARLIRHWGKIKSVRANAAALCLASEEAGGFGVWLGGWSGTRTVELWDELAGRFSQLGGNSGAYFLRMAGKDTFLATPDVARALDFWGVSDGAIKSKRGRVQMQKAFDLWAGETGRPLCQLGMILALSTD